MKAPDLLSKLVEDGHSVLVNQRADGSFVVWRGHKDPRLACMNRRTEGRTLDAALQAQLPRRRVLPPLHPWRREMKVSDE